MKKKQASDPRSRDLATALKLLAEIRAHFHPVVTMIDYPKWCAKVDRLLRDNDRTKGAAQ